MVNGDVGCVMLMGNVQNLEQITSKIKEGGLHTRGFEENTHITLLFGLDIEVLDPLSLDLHKFNFSDIVLEDISVFKTPWDFDVLKISVSSEDVLEANRYLSTFPYKSDFLDYKPHITIGYFNKGKADKYPQKLQRFVGDLKFTPTKLIWSQYNKKTQKYINLELKSF
jgi:2'-5' RNA ligase